jgi:flagellar motor switch protein FliG
VVLDHVVGEFVRELGADNVIKGGISETRKILANLLDKDSVSRIMDDVDAGGRTLWERLSNCSDQALAGFLRHEHPQTATVVLSKMRSDKAARILERLEPEFAQIIVLRLARVPRLDAEVVAIVKEVINRDFLSVMQREQATRRPADVIGAMMSNVSTSNRARLLKHLETEQPNLARQVQKVMFTYTDLVDRLDPKDVGTLLKGVEEPVLMRAMKMAQSNAPKVNSFFIDNVPKRMAQRLFGEVQQLGDVKPKDGEAAQAEVVRVARELAASGEITLVEADEEE